MRRRRRSGAGLCCAAALALLLALAPSAWAGGTWGSKADFTHLNVQWKDDGGDAAFFEVVKLRVPVESATTPDGRQCMVGQPDGSPNTVECPVPHVASGQVTITTTQPIFHSEFLPCVKVADVSFKAAIEILGMNAL